MTEWFESSTNWYPSRWGAKDELGTLNTITPEKILSAIELVKHGRVYVLAQPIFNNMPERGGVHGHLYYALCQRSSDHKTPFRKQTKNKFGSAIGRIEATDHLGTHMDALNHIAFDGKYYNGINASEIETPFGTTKLGIDRTPPLITRGVMIDVAAFKRLDVLPRGYAITIDDTESFLSENGIKIMSGDVVLFHTGVSKLWESQTVFSQFFESSPGVGYELAKWLAERDVAAVGADAPATEVLPPEIEGTYLPVHQYLITKSGIRIIDRMKLHELSKDGVYEFLFICSPLPIRGATASPVSPLAVV
jgi:kynurenine formamidase